MVRKRFLLLALTAAIVIAFLAYDLFKSAENGVFKSVDLTSFHCSGQNEGETITVEPNANGSVGGMMVPAFSRFSLARGIEEASKSLGIVPLIPTLLPEGIMYADVYVGPDVIICYNYNATEDFRFANVSMEISLSHSRVPTPEEMRKYLSGNELIQIGDKWVAINPNAIDNWDGEVFTSGGFHYNGLSYHIGVCRPLTTQDLIKIIESMKTPD